MTTPNVDTHDTAREESKCETNEDRLDELFDVLSDARRRRVVRILRADDRDATPVPALAAALAEREPDAASTDAIVTSLRHVHLPKLDVADVVDYDPDRSLVRYVGASDVDRLVDPV